MEDEQVHTWMVYIADTGYCFDKTPQFIVKGTKANIDELLDNYRWYGKLQPGKIFKADIVYSFESPQELYDKIDEDADREYKESIRGRMYRRYMKY